MRGQIFLDVDDLESIDLLEEYIEATARVMVFASHGYFQSASKGPTTRACIWALAWACLP